MKVFNVPSYLEDLTGLTQLLQDTRVSEVGIVVWTSLGGRRVLQQDTKSCLLLVSTYHTGRKYTDLRKTPFSRISVL